MALDPFAAALDELADLEIPAAPSLSSSPGAQSAAPIDDAVLGLQGASPAAPRACAGLAASIGAATATGGAAVKCNRNAGGTGGKRFHVGSKLELAPLEETDGIPKVATAFISLAGRADGTGSKRKRDDTVVPITLWPQYTIQGEKGRFVVLSAYEKWVGAMLHSTKVRGGGVGRDAQSASSFRDLCKGFNASLRAMLRTALLEFNAQTAALIMDDDEDKDDDVKPTACQKNTHNTFWILYQKGRVRERRGGEAQAHNSEQRQTFHSIA